MLRLVITSCYLCLATLSLRAQEVIASDGDYQNTAQGSLSWTLGEIVTETFSEPSGFLTQGFQQNYEALLDLSDLGPSLEFTLFPNPFHTELNLLFSKTSNEYELRVLDYQSKVIESQRLTFSAGTKEYTLDLSELGAGYYLLELTIPDTDQRIVRPIVKTH